MIRRLLDGEGLDATRFALHLETTDEATEQELAGEFRELLERARGRAASATDEVSALSMALAAAHAGAVVQQPVPVSRHENRVADLPEEPLEEENEEQFVEQGESSAQTVDSAQTEQATPHDDTASLDEEHLEVESLQDEQLFSAENPAESELKGEPVDEALSNAEVLVKEADLVPQEGDSEQQVAIQQEFVQPEIVRQEALKLNTATTDKATQKVAPDGAQKPLEFQVAPRAETPRVMSAEAPPEQPVHSLPMQFDIGSEQTQETPVHIGAELPKTSLTLPKVAVPERANDVSIQLAILRQAFESARGFASSQSEATPGGKMLSGQAVGVVSEARSARSAMQDKAARPLTRVQVHRMLEKVETAMKEAARSRDGKTIRFRVEPFNVGEVKVDVSLREGLLHARLKAENQQVTAVLREKAHELQGALRKLGLDVDHVTVTVSDEDDSQAAVGDHNLSDGKTFQDERNNMPSEEGQVVENTFGNKIAAVSEASTSSVTDAILDHWVA